MRLVVGISGASGAIYAKRLLDFLKTTAHEIHVTASENALEIGREEVGIDYKECGYPFYGSRDFTAPFASGSVPYDALAIVPCSMGMLGRIAHGYSDDLLARAADVFFKERRKVILVPRETPFSLIHIENMRLVTLAGAIVLPAIPSFYSLPRIQPQSGVEGEAPTALPVEGAYPSHEDSKGRVRTWPLDVSSGTGTTRAPTIIEAVDTVIARLLDHLGIENKLRKRWQET